MDDLLSTWPVSSPRLWVYYQKKFILPDDLHLINSIWNRAWSWKTNQWKCFQELYVSLLLLYIHFPRLLNLSFYYPYSDYEEYPQTCEIQVICKSEMGYWFRLLTNMLSNRQNRCINMIARMFHAPMDSSDEECMGCSTIGSSEAIILAVLAMKRRWQIMRESKGLSKEKPNLVMGANVQVNRDFIWLVDYLIEFLTWVFCHYRFAGRRQ